jgi:membrane fusion protein, multidrug efflux system
MTAPLQMPLEKAHRVRRFKLPTKPVFALSLALIAGAAGAWEIARAPSAESTDDAYVQADTTTVSPRVRGFLADLLVRDNQHVVAGQPLVRIDPEEYDAKVQSARADLATAMADEASARASLGQLDQEEGMSAAQINEAGASIGAAEAQRTKAINDDQRIRALLAQGFATRTTADATQAAAQSTAADVTRTRASLEVARRNLGVTQAKRGDLQAALARADASIAQRHAALDLALQDQRHSIIYAPISGSVGNRQSNVGDYLQPGTKLLSLVSDDIYVTAFFKETQTGRMLVGQRATIKVDALSGTTLHGHVESLAPGSGSSFALLPFEPGTGNFTKIVQRVPVRIRLDPGQPLAARLRPGLSATVRVELDR